MLAGPTSATSQETIHGSAPANVCNVDHRYPVVVAQYDCQTGVHPDKHWTISQCWFDVGPERPNIKPALSQYPVFAGLVCPQRASQPLICHSAACPLGKHTGALHLPLMYGNDRYSKAVLSIWRVPSSIYNPSTLLRIVPGVVPHYNPQRNPQCKPQCSWTRCNFVNFGPVLFPRM